MTTPADKLREKKREIAGMLREAGRLAGKPSATNDYAAAKERAIRHNRERTTKASDILSWPDVDSPLTELPACKNPERRERCRLDLHSFLREYFPNSTGLSPFGADHLRFIERLQKCILEGGWFVEAMPRGAAKSTIGENAILWATLNGHCRMFPIFGSSTENACNNLSSIKTELAENDFLYEDFPEVCHAVRALEGKANRCKGQQFRGERTYIEWGNHRVIFPTIESSKASGAVLCAYGLTAAFLGLKHKLPNGTVVRPEAVLIDDPQTDDSARSPMQVGKRLSTIKKSILRSTGHGKRIACFVAATIKQKGDVPDQLLDRKLNPAWQGERVKMMKSPAKAHEKWMGEYADIRKQFNPDDPADQMRAHLASTDFYRANQVEMDEGCEVFWPDIPRHETEISAIQHAYNILIDEGVEVFASECQNEPMDEAAEAKSALTPTLIFSKLNNLKRGQAPISALHVTAHIDVQGAALYWLVVAWSASFDGYVLDYGIYPEQGTRNIALRDIKRGLASAHKGTGEEGAIYAGLTALVTTLAGREWVREDNATMKLGKCLIDANWGKSTNTVYQFCQQSPHAAILMPSHGMGLGASSKPMMAYHRKPGEQVGTNWRVPLPEGRRSIRYVTFDTNFWKSFVASRIATAMGDRGCISLYGKDPAEHRTLAEHWISEYPISTTAKERTVDEWKLRPGHDNHWWDNMVGAAVGASMLGCGLIAGGAIVKKKRMSIAAMKARVGR